MSWSRLICSEASAYAGIGHDNDAVANKTIVGSRTIVGTEASRFMLGKSVSGRLYRSKGCRRQ